MGAKAIAFSEISKWMRPLVFWPPVVLLLAALSLSVVNFDAFHAGASAGNRWILVHFDWLFSYASFAAVVLVIWVWFSPLGRLRIGGPGAKPLLSRWNWFAITLCTTIAVGILFWGAAEPMFHVNGPPDFAGVEPHSDGAARFALSSMFMHWTITPYAIYVVPALAFALAHYNLGRPYSLSGPLAFVLGPLSRGRGAAIIDAIGLYALVAGVAASLGAGVMTLAGGLVSLTGISDGPLLRFAITLTIVAAYVVSSASGLQRGIRLLSDLNIRFFLVLCVFVLVAGPTWKVLSIGAEGMLAYVIEFVPRSLSLGERAGDGWTRDWTVFYFANWLAWAPITALFLGRISLGYTVREFILFNLLIPALFGGVWMTIFGGAAIELDATMGGTLTAALNDQGPEAVIYALFEALPLAAAVVPLFILITFISFVTAMDSNTHSIAGVCLKSPPTHEPGALSAGEPGRERAALWIKVFWGIIVGAVAWVMTSTTGIDGVRMLSNLGGLPGLFILIAMGAAIIKMRMTRLAELKAPVSATSASSLP